MDNTLIVNDISKFITYLEAEIFSHSYLLCVTLSVAWIWTVPLKTPKRERLVDSDIPLSSLQLEWTAEIQATLALC